jgi:uncharacterized protein
MIDIHTHIADEEVYNEYKEKNPNVSRIITIPWMKKSNIFSDIDKTLDFTSKHDDIFSLGTINMESSIDEQILRMRNLFEKKRIFGIKLYPGYQHFYPCDDSVIKIAELCAEFNKPLVFHTGDVYDLEGNAMLKYSQPIHVDSLAVKCRKTNIIIAHFGFPYLFDTANVVFKNSNVYTDISGTILNCDSEEELVSLIKAYILELKRVLMFFPEVRKKIMFGTDFTSKGSDLCQINGYIDCVEQIFVGEEKKLIFNDTAEKLFFS